MSTKSGAVLALEAAIRRLPVDKVAAYEPPFIPEGSRPRTAADADERLLRLVKAGDRDGATALFQSEMVGLPSEQDHGVLHQPAALLSCLREFLG
jgi:hypothetical protein